MKAQQKKQRLRRLLQIISALCLLIWLISAPLLGYLAQQQIQRHLPLLQTQLAKQGYQLELLRYQRGFWQSQSEWQIHLHGQPLSQLHATLQHGILSSAGANLLRLHWHNSATANTLMLPALSGQIRLNLAANLIANIESKIDEAASHAELRIPLIQRQIAYLTANHQSQGGSIPPLHLSAQIHRSPQAAPPNAASLPPLLQSLIADNWQIHATLTLYPNEQQEIQAEAKLIEQLNNPLQLIALRHRGSLISLLEGSQLHINLPLNHPNPQAILDFLARPPLLLQGTFTASAEKQHSAWQIQNGKITSY